MIQKWKPFFVILIASFIFTQCKYQKADILYPSTSCDTATVRLSMELKDILTPKCFICHGGEAEFAAGIKLENYEVIKRLALDGVLLSAITHDGTAPPMPKGGAKLSDCEINKFRAWINRGALDN